MGAQNLFSRIRSNFGQVFYGMALYEIERSHRRSRGALEHLFILITFGDIVGIPILPPYYALRLLPFASSHSRLVRLPVTPTLDPLLQ